MAARASQVSEPSRREAPRALPLVFFAGSAHGVLCSVFHPLLRMNELFVECIVGQAVTAWTFAHSGHSPPKRCGVRPSFITAKTEGPRPQ